MSGLLTQLYLFACFHAKEQSERVTFSAVTVGVFLLNALPASSLEHHVRSFASEVVFTECCPHPQRPHIKDSRYSLLMISA